MNELYSLFFYAKAATGKEIVFAFRFINFVLSRCHETLKQTINVITYLTERGLSYSDCANKLKEAIILY